MLTQRKWIVTTLVAFSAANALPGLAQNQGWRKFGEPVRLDQREQSEQAEQADQADQASPHLDHGASERVYFE